MADLSVPDGPRVEDLGINFRAMTSTILERYVAPRMKEIEEAYHRLEREIEALARAELAAAFAARAVPDWEGRAAGERDATARSALRAVARVAGAVCARHGRLWGEPALLAKVAARLALNEHGSVAIGRLIEPLVAEAVRGEGYALLPAQREPVVMNIKGASASGKSTMRPLQKRLAERDRRRLGRLRAHQPGHLAQAAARLRRAGRRVHATRAASPGRSCA